MIGEKIKMIQMTFFIFMIGTAFLFSCSEKLIEDERLVKMFDKYMDIDDELKIHKDTVYAYCSTNDIPLITNEICVLQQNKLTKRFFSKTITAMEQNILEEVWMSPGQHPIFYLKKEERNDKIYYHLLCQNKKVVSEFLNGDVVYSKKQNDWLYVILTNSSIN